LIAYTQNHMHSFVYKVKACYISNAGSLIYFKAA